MENGRWRTREAYYSRINKSYFPKVSDELPTRLIIITILFHLKTDDSVHKYLPKYHCTFIIFIVYYYVIIRIPPVSYLSRSYFARVVIRPVIFFKLYKTLLEPILLIETSTYFVIILVDADKSILELLKNYLIGWLPILKQFSIYFVTNLFNLYNYDVKWI